MGSHSSIAKSFLVLIVGASSLIGAISTDANPKGHVTNERLLKIERLLSDLGYWIVKVDGVADDSTRQAILAFQKVESLKRTGSVSQSLFESLQYATRPTARFNPGRPHVEIDISRQVLFLVNQDGTVARILPVSTGNDRPYVEKGKRQVAHTPRGPFKIQRQIKGVRHAPLGTLYYPNYFTEGVAIHGSGSVPATPASHGCVRIPRFAEKAFSALVWVGMEVFVYD